MSQKKESDVKKCEVVVDAASEHRKEQNYSTNTLKSVRNRIRNLTKKAANENSKSDSFGDQKEMNQDRSSDESLGKSKITLKKIFRKSSFKKIIQNFTNFTVSGLRLSAFIHNKERWKEKKKKKVVYRKTRLKKKYV